MVFSDFTSRFTRIVKLCKNAKVNFIIIQCLWGNFCIQTKFPICLLSNIWCFSPYIYSSSQLILNIIFWQSLEKSTTDGISIFIKFFIGLLTYVQVLWWTLDSEQSEESSSFAMFFFLFKLLVKTLLNSLRMTHLYGIKCLIVGT